MKVIVKNTFLIHNSSWQLLMAIELIHHQKISPNECQFVIFTYEKSETEKQIREFFKHETHDFNKIMISYKKNFLGKIKRYIDVFRNRSHGDNLYFAQTNVRWLSFYVRISVFNKLVLFDEGTHSLELIQQLESDSFNAPLPDLFFTQYSESRKLENGVELIENKLLLIGDKLKALSNKDVTWFVGQPLYKDDVSLETQASYIQAASNKSESGKFLYILHRHEDSRIIKKLNFFNINHHMPRICLEYLFFERGHLPSTIIGFSSSSLLTLKKILPKSVKINFLRIKESEIKLDRRERMSLFYSEMKKQGIEEWSSIE